MARKFFLLLLTAAAAGCYPDSEVVRVSTPVRVVEVIELRRRPVVERVSLLGETEPWRETTLYFEVSGIVDKVLVEEGMVVDIDQPIASLVPDDFQLGLSRAKARHEAAGADLDLLLAGTRKEDLEAAKADHDRARVLVSFWAGELKRNQELVLRGAVSDSDLQRVKSEHDASVQEELSTKARWQRAIAGPRQEEITAAAAEVEALAKAIALAERELRKANLVAPFRGRVEKRLVDEGAYVNVFPTGGVPIVHLVNLDSIDAVVAVPESSIARLEGVSTVEIVSAVNPETRADGEIVSLARVADPASGTYALRVRVPNSDGRFRGGMIVTATLVEEVTARAIQIPLTAVRRPYAQSAIVFLVGDDDRIVAAEVELGAIRGDLIEVTSGLSEAQLLVVRGQNQVIVGDRVRYERPAAPPAAKAETTP